MSKSVFNQQGCRALTFALARLSCVILVCTLLLTTDNAHQCLFFSATFLFGEMLYIKLAACQFMNIIKRLCMVLKHV